MLASELLDGLEALSDGPRHPKAPWFVRVLEPAFRHHALDRGHATSLPMLSLGNHRSRWLLPPPSWQRIDRLPRTRTHRVGSPTSCACTTHPVKVCPTRNGSIECSVSLPGAPAHSCRSGYVVLSRRIISDNLTLCLRSPRRKRLAALRTCSMPSSTVARRSSSFAEGRWSHNSDLRTSRPERALRTSSGGTASIPPGAKKWPNSDRSSSPRSGSDRSPARHERADRRRATQARSRSIDRRQRRASDRSDHRSRARSRSRTRDRTTKAESPSVRRGPARGAPRHRVRHRRRPSPHHTARSRPARRPTTRRP